MNTRKMNIEMNKIHNQVNGELKTYFHYQAFQLVNIQGEWNNIIIEISVEVCNVNSIECY